jgi:hypothetical protein
MGIGLDVGSVESDTADWQVDYDLGRGRASLAPHPRLYTDWKLGTANWELAACGREPAWPSPVSWL